MEGVVIESQMNTGSGNGVISRIRSPAARRKFVRAAITARGFRSKPTTFRTIARAVSTGGRFEASA
jgi:hypothetical protein